MNHVHGIQKVRGSNPLGSTHPRVHKFPYSNRAIYGRLKDTIHRVRSVTFQRGDHVSVGVHGQRNAAVIQRFHQDPRRHPLCQEQARARVAEVVEADPREPCFIEKFVE